jgi:hypothetical protein
MPTDPPEGYVSSADACRALGISDRTLRRRVQAGTLAGEYVARPQGSVLYVKLPDGHAAQQAAAGGTPPGDGEMQENAGENRENPTRQDAALAALFLERLDAAQTALLAATERAARAESERDAARQAAEAARAEAEALKRRGWWARLWNW